MHQFRLPALILAVVFLLSGGFAPNFASAQEATPVIGDDHLVGSDLPIGDDYLDHAFTCSEEAR